MSSKIHAGDASIDEPLMRHVFLPGYLFDSDTGSVKGKCYGDQKTDNSSPRVLSRVTIEHRTATESSPSKKGIRAPSPNIVLIRNDFQCNLSLNDCILSLEGDVSIQLIVTV